MHRGGFGGFGGGAQMQQMMKQAQAMQAQMQKQKQALEEKVFSAKSGGGMVEIEMDGALKIASLKINPQAVDPDDVEMLEDLVIAAVNDVVAQVKKERDALSGGML